MLHEFYPIAPNASWVARLAKAGAKTIQLRIKDEADQQVRRQIAASLELCEEHRCQLIVNDYWREAIELGADYIHLGQEDLAAADLPAIKRARLKLGVSTHDHDELDIALQAEPDYVALGPIYQTTLKIMKWEPQGLERVREWKALINCPLVAIGGLTVERARDVLDAGADSLAVVTDVVTHPDPERRIREWLAVATGRPRAVE